MQNNLSTKENFEANKHYYYIINILLYMKEHYFLINEKIIENDSVFFRYINIFFLLLADARSTNTINLKLDYNLDKIIRTENLEETDIEQLFILKHIALCILNYRDVTFDLDNAIDDVIELMRTYIDDDYDTRNYIYAISQDVDHESYDEIKEIYNNYFNS